MSVSDEAEIAAQTAMFNTPSVDSRLAVIEYHVSELLTQMATVQAKVADLKGAMYHKLDAMNAIVARMNLIDQSLREELDKKTNRRVRAVKLD